MAYLIPTKERLAHQPIAAPSLSLYGARPRGVAWQAPTCAPLRNHLSPDDAVDRRRVISRSPCSGLPCSTTEMVDSLLPLRMKDLMSLALSMLAAPPPRHRQMAHTSELLPLPLAPTTKLVPAVGLNVTSRWVMKFTMRMRLMLQQRARAVVSIQDGWMMETCLAFKLPSVDPPQLKRIKGCAKL